MKLVYCKSGKTANISVEIIAEKINKTHKINNYT